MGAGPRTGRRSIDRASIGVSYLRRDYRDWAAADREPPPAAQQLCYAYFHYHAKRTTDKFVLSGARDAPALADCLNTIVQLAFNIVLARNRAEANAARDITSAGRVRYTRAWDTNGRGARLATERRSELGRSFVLGDTAAELAARFDLTVTLTVYQLHRLRARPDALETILSAFESAVPLNLDYRLILSVRDQDRTFRLLPTANSAREADKKEPAEPRSGAGRFPLLGITTALGAG